MSNPIVCGKCHVVADVAVSYARYRSDAPLCQPCENGEHEADLDEATVKVATRKPRR